MAERPGLRALADELGIVASYRGHDGETRHTSDATRIALLAAMGVDVSSERQARETLAQRREARRQLRIDPVRVTRIGDAQARMLPTYLGRGGGWRVEVDLESGAHRQAEGSSLGDGAFIRLPAVNETGRHRLRLFVRSAAGEVAAEQMWIVAPKCCTSVRERIGGDRAFGVLANLYSVRDGKRPFGDIATLKRLVRWAGGAGAAFVGVNPLHAIRAGNAEISPYSPITRMFHSELYLDLEAIPELRDCASARRLLDRSRRDAPRIDYAAERAFRWKVLRALHGVFRRRARSGSDARRRAYSRYVVAGGARLEGFALFRALDEHFGTDRGGTDGWRSWPVQYRDPESVAVAEFARMHADEVDLHRWVQFEIDRQLAGVDRAAQRSGLALGIYQDLPIGAVPSGCEEWLLRSLFCSGATIGAPPDAFFAGGQTWGLAPIDPHAMRAGAYAYWSDLLQRAFAHAGALRIDHIMGLARQYWVPQGGSARDGAYVRMPADELFGVLALESRQANAVVIGEDLGTVPEEIPPLLERWGVLSTKVLYFERTANGGFRSPSSFPRRAFVSVNTHDLATLAGYEAALDVELNHRAGVLDEERARQAQAARGDEVESLRRWANVAPGGSSSAAVYARLATAPSALLGVSLDDLAGEREPVNLPGVPGDVYPSWRRRMGRTVGEIISDPVVDETLRSIRGARPAPSPPKR